MTARSTGPMPLTTVCVQQHAPKWFWVLLAVNWNVPYVIHFLTWQQQKVYVCNQLRKRFELLLQGEIAKYFMLRVCVEWKCDGVYGCDEKDIGNNIQKKASHMVTTTTTLFTIWFVELINKTRIYIHSSRPTKLSHLAHERYICFSNLWYHCMQILTVYETVIATHDEFVHFVRFLASFWIMLWVYVST